MTLKFDVEGMDPEQVAQYISGLLYDGLIEEVEIDGEKQLAITPLGKTLVGLMERKPHILEEVRGMDLSMDEIIQLLRD